MSTSKCSVNETDIVDIKKNSVTNVTDEIPTDNADFNLSNENSFTWKRICKSYTSRDK